MELPEPPQKTRKTLDAISPLPSPTVTELEEVDEPVVKLQPSKLEDYFFPSHRLKNRLEGTISSFVYCDGKFYSSFFFFVVRVIMSYGHF